MGLLRFARQNNTVENGRQSGSALIAALGIMLVLDLFAVSALAMSVSQTNMTAQERKGNTAFNIAEAGLNKAIWKFDNTADYEPTSGSPDNGSVPGGEYDIVVTDVAGQPTQKQIEVTSYVPNKTDPKVKKRKILATVEIVPVSLKTGMFASGYIYNQGSAVAFLAPLDYNAPGAKGGDIGSNGNITWQDNGLSLNDRSAGATTFDALFGNPPVPRGDIITAGPDSHVYYKGTEIMPGLLPNEQVGTNSDIYMHAVRHLPNPVIMPTFDFEGFRTQARANTDTRNTAMRGADGSGFYTAAEFTTKVLGSGNNITYYGPMYVDGNVSIPKNKNLTIVDGMLIIKGASANALVQDKSSLIKVTHGSAASEEMPGLMVYSAAGNLAKITSAGSLDVQGLVYAESECTIDVQGTWTIRGALLTGKNTGANVYMKNSTLIIQYDPAITKITGVIDTGTVMVNKVLYWREVSS